MSAAERRARSCRRRKMSGFTFIEVMITLGLMTLLATIVERTISSTREAERYLGVFAHVQERTDAASYDVYAAVVSARRIYGRDEMGAGYLDALDLNRWPLASGARLPLPDELAPMGPDQPDDPRTGNIIMCVRETDPVVCSANPTEQATRYIDVYHFVCVYPHESTRHLISNDEQDARDLVLWYSVGYPSHPQVMAIEDVDERKSVVRDLYHRLGYERAWDPTGGVDDAFYALDALGTVSAGPVPVDSIPEHQGLSEGGLFVHADIQLARTRTGSFSRRSVFTVDDPETWVPDGFEVKITGESGHRKVWFHVVGEGQSGRGREATHMTTLIASARDL